MHCLFPEQQHAEVEKCLLAMCGDNLPGVETGYALLAERIRFAVLKLSGGDTAKLQDAIAGAAVDWRDILVSAGFASHAQQHLAWQPDCRQGS